MPVSEATYERVALEDPEGHWELVCGELRRKPPMTMEHNDVAFELAHALRSQLGRAQFHVRCDQGRLRHGRGSYYIPDVMVIPVGLTLQFRGRSDTLETYRDPLPLVVEVWSPSTGDYDVREKLRDYQARGDQEIWLVHPYERTITAWRRQPDGSYAVATQAGGKVESEALRGVTVDFDNLFGPDQ